MAHFLASQNDLTVPSAQLKQLVPEPTIGNVRLLTNRFWEKKSRARPGITLAAIPMSYLKNEAREVVLRCSLEIHHIVTSKVDAVS
ncbi:hypothetical protein HYFRA_00010674 [Hymenoscyphus fraxineus]|uniref:Uncharacterized protein n=1 Tax=Hymenoscyphus fraxineus TaxID=746836 RepID=A0A9N9L9K6_9HELO|nr:hypothetical protein HYFRA_00010674 [Hymenoscyphus fraxineus]